MKQFNLNDYLYIQITEDGVDYLRRTFKEDYIKNCIESRKVIVDGTTYYRLQAHTVFYDLPIQYGGTMFFNPDVLIEDEHLKEVTK